MIRLIVNNVKYITTLLEFKLYILITLVYNTLYIMYISAIDDVSFFANGLDGGLLTSFDMMPLQDFLNYTGFIIFLIFLTCRLSEYIHKLKSREMFEVLRVGHTKVFIARVISIWMIAFVMTFLLYGLNIIGLHIYCHMNPVQINGIEATGYYGHRWFYFDYLYSLHTLSEMMLYNPTVYTIIHCFMFTLYVSSFAFLIDAISLFTTKTRMKCIIVLGYLFGSLGIAGKFGYHEYTYISLFFQQMGIPPDTSFNNFVTRTLFWVVLTFIISLILYLVNRYIRKSYKNFDI